LDRIKSIVAASHSTIKQYSIYKTSSQSSKMAETAQDTESTHSSDDTQFTRVVWIGLHNALSNSIKVYDISSDVLDKPDVFTEAKSLSKSLSNTKPTYSFKQKGWWKPYKLYDGDYSDDTSTPIVVADWKASNHFWMTQKFSFPPGSSHSDHDVAMKIVKSKFRDEGFVHNSVEYVWKFDNIWTRSKMSLIKKIGQEKKVVARCVGPFPGISISGALAVNEEEIDFVVALLTCCGVMRKDRQRK
jgi:hypothetical protein